MISALASADNTLLDLLNFSYPTQPHSLIAKYALVGLIKSIYIFSLTLVTSS